MTRRRDWRMGSIDDELRVLNLKYMERWMGAGSRNVIVERWRESPVGYAKLRRINDEGKAGNATKRTFRTRLLEDSWLVP